MKHNALFSVLLVISSYKTITIAPPAPQLLEQLSEKEKEDLFKSLGEAHKLLSKGHIYQQQLLNLHSQAIEATKEYLQNNPSAEQIKHSIAYLEYHDYPIIPSSFEHLKILESYLVAADIHFVHKISDIAHAMIKEHYEYKGKEMPEGHILKSPESETMYKKIIDMLKKTLNQKESK